MTQYEIMFHKALIDLQARFKSGAFDYAVQKYPQFWDVESRLIGDVREAWKQPDKAVFREALKKWYSFLRRAFEKFNEEV